MRPQRLELEGFTAFRERTVVDFEGAELFALSGPTGAGKSSLIDAMVFALYGSVPRFDDDRLVGAVVSQGRVEAKVRLDFTVGSSRCTAVRVVRLRDGRATTKEARFERDGEVIAGSARDLDRAVSDLLGLDLRQFTTCVVLPQGQFARFLQEEPRKRQDLLMRLLELGLYDRLRESAARRADRLDGELSGLVVRADALGEGDAAQLDSARSRVEALAAALARVEQAAPALEALERGLGLLAEEVADAQRRRQLLADLATPEHVPALASLSAAARAFVAAADAAELDVAAELEAAEAAVEQLGDRGPLERWRAAYEALPALEELAAERHAEHAAAAARSAEATARAASASLASLEADRAYEQVLTDNRVAAVRVHLVAGAPCPVCARTVDVLPPQTEDPPEVTSFRADRAAAHERAEAALEARQQAELALATTEERVRQSAADVEEGWRALEAAPSPAELARRLAVLDAAAATVAAARVARDASARERRRGHDELVALVEAERESWRTFDDVRDRVASLGAPVARRDDLAEAWNELVAWAQGRRPELEAEIARASSCMADARAERARATSALDTLLREAEVDAGARPHREALVVAMAAAEQSVVAIERVMAERARLAQRQKEVRRHHEVAKALRLELQANRFEKWVLDQAMRELCVSATTLLHQLSQAAFSLALDDKRGFMVVDHRNADELRLARTLSGGETFLASVALALALAEQVAMVAPGGTTRLESIFLDEGFGTLDPETLDIVAGAIEDLGASGRMVGLVSHVPELAERVPVRFDVRRGPRSSTVTRVDQ